MLAFAASYVEYFYLQNIEIELPVIISRLSHVLLEQSCDKLRYIRSRVFLEKVVWGKGGGRGSLVNCWQFKRMTCQFTTNIDQWSKR